MTNAFAYAGSYNGFGFGAGQPPVSGLPASTRVSVRSLTGFRSTKGSAAITENPLGGAHVGPVVLGSKPVALGFNLHTAAPAHLLTLLDVIDEYFAPSTVDLPLTVNGQIMFVKALEIDPGMDPSWPGPERTAPCDITLLAGDPGRYSTADDLPFGAITPVTSVDLPWTNTGTRPTRSGHAWTVRITAHGTTTSPFIQIGDQIVTWQGLTMTGGQVLTVDEMRTSRVGTLNVDSYRRSADASIFPDHPVLLPGDNTITIGCATGAVSGNFHPRATR